MDNQNSDYAPAPSPNARIKLNVGGKLFETTVSTLQSGGPESLLSVLSTRPTDDPVFIDRDPEIFSVLLSLLRSNRLPSTSLRFSKQDLADEAIYYGIDSCLRSAMSPPPLSGIDASLVANVCPSSDPVPSSFTASKHDGSLWIAHGGQISSYDWNLAHSGTFRTHIDDITSICRVWDDVADVAAIGSESFSGLHFYNLHSGKYIESTQWTDQADPRIYKAKVAAVTTSSTHVFASFDCPHRENCILTIDKSTLRISSEIARQLGSSAKNTVPRKLTWLPETNLLLGTSVQCGAFGYSGYVRIWDPRSGSVIWETNEPGVGRSSRFGDPFADVDADVEGLTLFKICSKSGDLAMADLRNLKEDDPWVYMNDLNPSMRATVDGEGFTIHCYKGQVFVGRDGEMEVWSRTQENKKDKDNAMLYRRNFVDKVEDAKRGIIRKIEGGGDRLFVSRENAEGIEVWESSSLSGAISSVL